MFFFERSVNEIAISSRKLKNKYETDVFLLPMIRYIVNGLKDSRGPKTSLYEATTLKELNQKLKSYQLTSLEQTNKEKRNNGERRNNNHNKKSEHNNEVKKS